MYFITAKCSVLNMLYAVYFFYVRLSLFLLVYNFFMGHVAWIKPDLVWFKLQWVNENPLLLNIGMYLNMYFCSLPSLLNGILHKQLILLPS